MAQDDDLFNLEDLDEQPDFGMLEDELSADEFPIPTEEGGLSTAFKLAVAVIALGVIGLVVLLVLFAFSGGDDLSSGEKTASSVAGTNVALQEQYNATLTALAIMDAATATAVENVNRTATAEAIQRQTQAAIDATNAANTATAEFQARQTQSAIQTATQEAINLGLTATAEANRLTGLVIDQQGTIFGNATLRLYRDDGDGEFNPVEEVPVPTPGAGISGPVQRISYGESVQGTLNVEDVVEWSFNGTAGDTVTVDAVAADPVQMDMFLELLGPTGLLLIGDDDSGDESNARISAFRLRDSGAHVIRVSSSAGGGDYTLMLSLGLAVPEAATPAPDTTEEPAATPGGSAGIMLVSNDGGESRPAAAQEGTATPPAPVAPQPTAQPTQEIVPTAELGDELIDTIITTAEGQFDFGSLEPGVYWLQLDYDTLPPDLKALVAPGTPLVIKVTVPTAGEITFEIGGPVVTATPTGPSPFELTATQYALNQTLTPGTPGTPLPTMTAGSPPAIVTLTASPEALPTTGFFSDVGDSAGSLEGSGGLTILAIAAVGLIAVVFIARKLRTSA